MIRQYLPSLPSLPDWATSGESLLLGGLAVFGFIAISGDALPTSIGVQVVVILELAATYLVLQLLGAYNWRLYAVIASSTTVIALSAMGEPIIGSLVNSRVGPILVLGALYITYKAVADADRKVIVRRGKK